MPQEPSPTTPAPLSPRLVSLDVYRGWVMLLMMAGLTLGLSAVSKALPQSGFWALLAHHQSHAVWGGCSLHDLIQPSFSYIVGVALPFSIATRLARGQTMGKLTLHAAWRSLILIALGVLLRSVGQPQTYYTFTDTLDQIGFGYTFLFLLGFCSVRTQWIVFASILVAVWLAFALYPLPGSNFDFAGVGQTPEWLKNYGFQGFQAHWNLNSHPFWAFDVWFLNLFPRTACFMGNPGGTSTLNFIPTLATMILGLITGEKLRETSTNAWQKLIWLGVAGTVALVVGWALGAIGVCPVVKKLWTPSWVLFSGGWCLLFMALFYLLVDLWKVRFWTLPFIVVGINSIAAYCLAHVMKDFIRSSLLTHLGANTFRFFGKAYEPLVLGGATLLGLWLVLLWMHRRKLYLRV